jgi:hypothetical protein
MLTPDELAMIETDALVAELDRRYPAGLVLAFIPSDPDTKVDCLVHRYGPWFNVGGLVQALDWTLAKYFQRETKNQKSLAEDPEEPI